MTEDTNPHNGTVQRQIWDLSIQENSRVTILLQKELISHKAKKGYLIRNIRTQFLQKELGNLINNQTVAEKRMITQKTRFFPL